MRFGSIVSELDKALAALEARRAPEEAERRRRRNLACDLLRSFHENDVKPSGRLKARGIEASFHDGKLADRRDHRALQFLKWVRRGSRGAA
jgi:hypothetical protein